MKVMVKKNRNLSQGQYLNKIKPYLRNEIIDLPNSDAWKIQLTIAINFISSKDVEEEYVMHSRSDNIKFTLKFRIIVPPPPIVNFLKLFYPGNFYSNPPFY